MEIISSDDVSKKDTRDSKKMILTTDAICVKCGVIFNINFEDNCIICKSEEDLDLDDKCDHKEFITGNESVDLRILLDFHMEDLKALCELHGCPEGSRNKIVINIMKKLHSRLDKRINEDLVRKVVLRNKKKFWYLRDIEKVMKRIKKKKMGIPIISADECIEIIDDKNLIYEG